MRSTVYLHKIIIFFLPTMRNCQVSRTFGVFVVASLLLSWWTSGSENSCHVEGFPLVVSKDHRAVGSLQMQQGKIQRRKTSLNALAPWMVNGFLLSTDTLDGASEGGRNNIAFFLDAGTITTGLISTVVLLMVPVLSDNGVSENGSRQSSDGSSENGMGRRGTLMTIATGAASLAASDMLLGTAGKLLSGVAGGVSSFVYDARWLSLFQRVAQHRKEYEATAASPELLAWISRTPAAFSNPELRAWVAANRAFNKSRQVAMAAIALEEGVASVGVVAAAVVARGAKKNQLETAAIEEEGEGEIFESVDCKESMVSQVLDTKDKKATERLAASKQQGEDEQDDHLNRC